MQTDWWRDFGFRQCAKTQRAPTGNAQKLRERLRMVLAAVSVSSGDMQNQGAVMVSLSACKGPRSRHGWLQSQTACETRSCYRQILRKLTGQLCMGKRYRSPIYASAGLRKLLSVTRPRQSLRETGCLPRHNILQHKLIEKLRVASETADIREIRPLCTGRASHVVRAYYGQCPGCIKTGMLQGDRQRTQSALDTKPRRASVDEIDYGCRTLRRHTNMQSAVANGLNSELNMKIRKRLPKP